MSARDDIFANIRRSLGVKGSETHPPADRGRPAGARAEGRHPGQRGQVSGEERIALFKTRPRRRSPR